MPSVGGQETTVDVVRNTGVTWSGSVTFGAETSKLYLNLAEDPGDSLPSSWRESEWTRSLAITGSISKEGNKWEIDVRNSELPFYFKDFRNVEINKLHRYDCKKAEALKNKPIPKDKLIEGTVWTEGGKLFFTKEPEPDSSDYMAVKQDETVKIIRKETGWYFVETSSGKKGWIAGYYVHIQQ